MVCFVCLCVCVCVRFCLSCLFSCLLRACLFACLFACLLVRLFACSFLCVFVCLFVCLFVRLRLCSLVSPTMACLLFDTLGRPTTHFTFHGEVVTPIMCGGKLGGVVGTSARLEKNMFFSLLLVFPCAFCCVLFALFALWFCFALFSCLSVCLCLFCACVCVLPPLSSSSVCEIFPEGLMLLAIRGNHSRADYP